MAGYAIGDKVLDGWEIVRLIGEGGYGRVYEVRKGIGSRPSASTSSALKVVSIPPSESLVESALAEGASREAVAAEYREIADSFMDEAALLSSLSHPGIVGYQDHQSIPHPDGIGWDILLRMELLEPLTRLMSRSPLGEGETVRLGAELADALAFCHARGIIHRDVKPENIFADASGRYKLGDFGVSRTVEGTSGTLSRKGTEDYMAPELYYEQHSGAAVDVYALGLVLYRLLNGNRLPFLPPAPQPVRYADRQAAQRRRLSGEPLPRPAGCAPELFAIVERACAHDPEKRPTAEELRDALWEYGRSHGVAPYPRAGANAAGATHGRPAPQPTGAASRTRNVWSAFGPQAAPTPAPEPSPARVSAPKREVAPVRRADAPIPSPESTGKTAQAGSAPARAAAELGPKPVPLKPTMLEPAVPEGPIPVKPDAAAPPAARPKARKPGVGGIVGVGIAVLAVVLVLGISALQGFQQPQESDSAGSASSMSTTSESSSASMEYQLGFPLDLAQLHPDSPEGVSELVSILNGLYEESIDNQYFDFFANKEMADAQYNPYLITDYAEAHGSIVWSLSLQWYDGEGVHDLSCEEIASGEHTVTDASLDCEFPEGTNLSCEEKAEYLAQAFGYEKVAIWEEDDRVRGWAIADGALASVDDVFWVSGEWAGLYIVVDYAPYANALKMFDDAYYSDEFLEEHPDVYRISRVD